MPLLDKLEFLVFKDDKQQERRPQDSLCASLRVSTGATGNLFSSPERMDDYAVLSIPGRQPTSYKLK